MEFGWAIDVFKESAISFLGLIPYLLIGLFVGAALDVALSKKREMRWLKQPGIGSYLTVSLAGAGTPL